MSLAHGRDVRGLRPDLPSRPRSAPPLRARLAQGREALLALGPAWRALDTRAAQVPAPYDLLVQASGSLSASAPLLVLVESGDRLVGAWPLRVQRFGPVSMATRLGRAIQPFDGLTTDAHHDGAAIARAAWAALAADRPVDVVALPHLLAESPLLAVDELRHHAAVAGTTMGVDLSAYDAPGDWAESRSRSQRRTLRRSREALARMGEVRFEVLDAPSRRRSAFLEALALKLAWADERQEVAATLRAPWFAAAWLRAVADPHLGESVRVFRLSVDGRTAAVEVGLVCRGTRTFQSYLGAWAPEFAAASAGLLLTADTIAWCIGAGLERYDLLPPVSEFKARWGDDPREVRSSLVAFSLAGRLVEPVVRDGREHVRAMVGRLPDPVQALLRVAVSRAW